MISCAGYLKGIIKKIGIAFSSRVRYMGQRLEQYVKSGIDTDAYLIMIASRNRRFKFCQMIRTLEISLKRTHDKAGATVLLVPQI